MVRGCLNWQRDGLNPPHAVSDATDEYLDDEDSVKQWLDEKYERDPNGYELIGDLFTRWKEWAIENGEGFGNAKRLSQKLKALKFEPGRRSIGRGFLGLRSRRDSFQQVRPT